MHKKMKQVGQNRPFWLKIFFARCARGKKSGQLGAGRRPAKQNFDFTAAAPAFEGRTPEQNSLCRFNKRAEIAVRKALCGQVVPQKGTIWGTVRRGPNLLDRVGEMGRDVPDTSPLSDGPRVAPSCRAFAPPIPTSPTRCPALRSRSREHRRKKHKAQL